MQISKLNLNFPAIYNGITNKRQATITNPQKQEDTTYPHKPLHYIYFTGITPKNIQNIRKEVINTIKDLYEDCGFEPEIVENIRSKYTDLDDETIILAHELFNDSRFKKESVNGIIALVKDFNIQLAKKMCNEKSFGQAEIIRILHSLTPENIHFVEKLWDTNGFPREILQTMLIFYSGTLGKFGKKEEAGIPYFIKMYQQCTKNPKDYLTAENSDINELSAVRQFFGMNTTKLFKLCMLQDNELNDILLRKRFTECQKYLLILDNFSTEQMNIFKTALKCNSVKGKKLSPPEKLELINLIKTISVCSMKYENFTQMINKGEINLYKIKEDIITQIMKNCYENTEHFETTVTADKLKLWDVNNAYLLSKELQKSNTKNFKIILKLANRPEEFKELIKNEAVNQQTAKLFCENGLDYEKWLSPSKINNVHLKITDNNAEKLRNIEKAFNESVNELLKTPVKGYIKKKYPNYIQKEEFSLPKKITGNKLSVIEFMKNFISELEPVWERAEQNKTGAKRAQALYTLTIKDHINTFINAAKNIETIYDKKDLDLTIKMWDRFPQHDLFQGNYSTCCIGIGNVNSAAMIDYLSKTAFNMIELVDNRTGNTIGNALCYYAKEGNIPVLIIDNIEINNSFRPSDLSCKYIREGLKEYGKRLNKEITGQTNTPIYLGKNYNDVPTEDLCIRKEARLKLIGELRDENASDTYLDAFGGWRDTEQICKYPCQTNMFKLV